MFANISVNCNQFLIKIWDAAVVQLMYLGRPKPRIEQLEKDRAELRAKAADINGSISQAEREGQKPSNQIQQWLSEVEELEGKSVTTKQDFERRNCLGGWSWNCCSVNRRVIKRLDDIDKLMTRADSTPFFVIPPPPAIVHIPTSDSTPGMEAHVREILGHIASANAVGIIGVYGMGGVGKTTLLTSINNHSDVAVFDHVIWAVATKEWKIERLQMDIAKRLKLRLEEDDTEEDRATKLFDFLKDKDCLLLLDDLWEPLPLAKLGMTHAPLGQGVEKRKVVVFTTRNEQVCGDMKPSTKMEIKCLEQEQAWELFRMNAGEDAIESDPGINYIAHRIAEECGGLPLALVTVGKAMSTKKSWEAWNDALTQMMHSDMPKITGTKEVDPMFSAFKLSYDSLEDDDVRGRLLSCALWPEDHSINKEELIACWMGLGLIHEVGAIHKAYNRGHSHIDTLKAACLLKPGNNKETEVKMHDVIRDMALWMASDCGIKKFKWIVRAGVVESQALEEEGWHETERASLMYNDISSLPNQLSTCSKLSVLMLKCNYNLKEIHGTLMETMVALTYLDLESTKILELPKEIGMLLQLQHLNLSHTPIRKLPVELRYLVKLNYLLMRDTFIDRVAKGAISSLSSLRLLDLTESPLDDNWWDELEGLKGCQKSIGVTIYTETDLQRLCSLPHVSIWRLIARISTYSANPHQLLDHIRKSQNTRQSMEQLTIELANMNELLISKGNKEAGGFECLKYLNLTVLTELQEIMWKGIQPHIVFPNLRELIIYGCRKLKNVSWALQLPSLSFLSISACKDMEELITDESNSASSSTFGLKRIELHSLANLKRISQRPLYFPFLREIEVLDCPLLRKLPFDNRIFVNKLNVIRCEPAWWNELEWDEISIKHSFSPLVEIIPLHLLDIIGPVELMTVWRAARR